MGDSARRNRPRRGRRNRRRNRSRHWHGDRSGQKAVAPAESESGPQQKRWSFPPENSPKELRGKSIGSPSGSMPTGKVQNGRARPGNSRPRLCQEISRGDDELRVPPRSRPRRPPGGRQDRNHHHAVTLPRLSSPRLMANLFVRKSVAGLRRRHRRARRAQAHRSTSGISPRWASAPRSAPASSPPPAPRSSGDPLRPGAGPAIVLSFLLTAVACGFAALCYAEFAAMVPIAGSAYTYAYASLGELVAWIIGWDLIIEYAVGNIGVAIGWAGYFRELLEPFRALAAGLARDRLPLGAHGRRGDRGRRHATRPTRTSPRRSTTAPHLFGVPVIANLPAFLVVAADHRAPGDRHPGVGQLEQRDGAAQDRHHPVLRRGRRHPDQAVQLERSRARAASRPTGSPASAPAAAIIFFSYIGFDAISTAAEEAKDPARDMPFGIIMSLVVCTVLYIVLSAGDDRHGAVAASSAPPSR